MQAAATGAASVRGQQAFGRLLPMGRPEVSYFFDEPEVPIYSAIWEQRRDMRSLVFLVPGQNPRLGPVALKMIPEIRSVAAVCDVDSDRLAAAQAKVGGPCKAFFT